ncbi:PREDICTED: ribosomal RNA-processing protein 8, partial [Ficedula albicollis]|uniref:ribosomal RNA-processing protein 8 n=1 Tax=Ficedula albicollis TaxID=59894 RepID=UPI0007AD8CBD
PPGSSRDAARLFRTDPTAFHLYHRGFEQQVRRWPERPVQRIVRYLRRRPASLVVADFGCGDCTLAASVKNQVHCFDLVALSPRVTVCDMAKVPLAAESVDVAVFCLALMGTNLREILGEANRVLKLGGTLMVAEVASRFEDTHAFLKAMTQLGFKTVSKDLSSSYFYVLEFAKTGPARPGAAPALCGEQQRRRTDPAGSEGPVGPFPGPWAALVVRRVLPRDSPAPGFCPWQALLEPVQGDGRHPIPGRGRAVLGPRSRGTRCDSSLRGHWGRGLCGSRRDSVLGRADFPPRRS